MAIITSLSMATPQQPHSGSSLTRTDCISLSFPPQNPHRHQISLTHHCPSLSSSPKSTKNPSACDGGGNFGGSDGGGNFGGSGGGSGGEGSEVDSGDMIVLRKEDFDQFVSDARKTIFENYENRVDQDLLLYCINMGIITVPLCALLNSEIEDMKKFRDKNCKQARSELA